MTANPPPLPARLTDVQAMIGWLDTAIEMEDDPDHKLGLRRCRKLLRTLAARPDDAAVGDRLSALERAYDNCHYDDGWHGIEELKAAVQQLLESKP